jgi:hypothetical protein
VTLLTWMSPVMEPDVMTSRTWTLSGLNFIQMFRKSGTL